LAKNLEKEIRSNQGVGAAVRTSSEQFNEGRSTIFLALLERWDFVLLDRVRQRRESAAFAIALAGEEISIRSALGASRSRVVRQLLIESVLDGADRRRPQPAARMLGVRTFDLAVANVGKPTGSVHDDYTVFGYFAAISVLTGILFGLPGAPISKLDVNENRRRTAAARAADRG